MADDEDDLAGLKGDDRIIEEAKKRFQRCKEWESRAQDHFRQDYKFANADAYNLYQWTNDAQTGIGGGGSAGAPIDQPVKLTINKTRQHNLQIINDAKQNKPGVNIRPTGGDATFDAAQAFEGVVRYIEKISRAEQAYDTATTFMVEGGVGYWRIVTEYAANDTFDQEIFIKRIKNPLAVFIDPDCNELDGSDARFGFVFDDMPRDEFINRYPRFRDEIGQNTVDSAGNDWLDEKHVRVAEYFVKGTKKDKLLSFIDPDSGQQITTRLSKMPKDIAKPILDDPSTRTRDIEDEEIMWYKIAGDSIIDRRPWLGKYIPIVRIIGEETVIDGILDRKGHTRAMIDPNRIYNYWSSAAVRQVAFQTVSPWLIPMGGTEELETYYERLNTGNPPAWIPYNAVDEQGNPLPAPQRADPPVMAEAFIKGMSIAQTEMMMASGQYQSQFGQNENATSGKAIAERQRQGDNATYHYIDSLANGIRFTGLILLDLIPKVYDTPRTLRILGEDGTETQVELNPAATDAFQEASDREGALAIFNPSVGRYAVESDVGPSYATRRQEAWNAMTQIVSQNMDLVRVIGDLLFRNADFPGADEIAERLKRMVPPNILGEAPPPDMVALQQHNAQLQQTLAEIIQQLADKDRELKDKTADHQIREFEADSKRITAVSNAVPELGDDKLKPLIQQMIDEALSIRMPDAEKPPVEGARKAKDGNWYVSDPNRQGKFLQVQPADEEEMA